MLVQEIITERININQDIHDKIEKAFRKWAQYLPSEIESSPRFDQFNYEVHTKSKSIGEKLRRFLAPTIQQIVKQNLPNIQDENYEGHKISVEVDIDENRPHKGSVQRQWSKLYTKRPKYIYKNQLSIFVTPYEISVLLANYTDNVLNDLVSTVTHELTHIIQSMRSTKQDMYVKPYTRAGNQTENDWYYQSKIEIDAHAQGTATKMLLAANKVTDPKAYIIHLLQLIKMGTVDMFGKNIVPNQDYNKIKANLTARTGNPKLDTAKSKAWQRYNKKLYDKLANAIQ